MFRLKCVHACLLWWFLNYLQIEPGAPWINTVVATMDIVSVIEKRVYEVGNKKQQKTCVLVCKKGKMLLMKNLYQMI